MCGIVGFIDNKITYDFKAVGLKMSNALHSRGPDSKGAWHDEALGVSLMHSRLAVLDLSPAGCQPMLSSDGRYVIVFNGEIYNFEQICKDIEMKFGSVDWRGHSDTEIILMAVIVYGVEGTLSLLE
nr:asparagine synthetase B [Burkholderiales bacterium]